MPFLNLSNANIQFAEKELTCRSYTTKEVLSTTRWVELIDKKKFTKATLDKNVEVFVVHVAFLISKMLIHLAQEAQIALLIAKKITVTAEYTDFADVFLKKLAKVLP